MAAPHVAGVAALMASVAPEPVRRRAARAAAPARRPRGGAGQRGLRRRARLRARRERGHELRHRPSRRACACSARRARGATTQAQIAVLGASEVVARVVVKLDGRRVAQRARRPPSRASVRVRARTGRRFVGRRAGGRRPDARAGERPRPRPAPGQARCALGWRSEARNERDRPARHRSARPVAVLPSRRRRRARGAHDHDERREPGSGRGRRPRVLLPPRDAPPHRGSASSEAAPRTGIADAARGIVDAGLSDRALSAWRPVAAQVHAARAQRGLPRHELRQPRAEPHPRPAPGPRRRPRDDLESGAGLAPQRPDRDASPSTASRRRAASSSRSSSISATPQCARGPHVHDRRAVRDYIAAIPPARSGYVDLEFAHTLHTVPYEGVDCTRATLVSGAYPARRTLGFVTRGRPRARSLASCAGSSAIATAKRVIATRYVVPS